MSLQYMIIKDLFEKIKDTNKCIKLEYKTGDYSLIRPDFKISTEYSEDYLIVDGYEYVLTDKKDVYSVIDLREVRNAHILDIDKELKDIREGISKIWNYTDFKI